MLRFSLALSAASLMCFGAAFALVYWQHREMTKEAARAVGQVIVPATSPWQLPATFKERFEPDFATLMAPSLYDLHPLWKEAPFGERLKGVEYQP
jgi:hypothetical protein